MRTFRIWALICAVGLGSTACTATGGIRENFYVPSSQDVQKLPLRVALVTDSAMKSQRLTLRNMMRGDTIEVNLHPGLINAVRSELAAVFQDVTIVESAKQAKEQDLLAIPNLSFEQTDPLGGAFKSQIKITFKDIRSGTLVTSYDQIAVRMIPQPSGGEVLGQAAMAGASLGLLLPLALHQQANSQLERATQSMEEGIALSLRAISADIQGDRIWGMYLAGKLTGIGESTVAAVPRAPAAPMSDVDTLPTGKSVLKKNAYAVVIGIEQYRENLPKAEFAARDARLVGEYLSKTMGYPEGNVVVMLNERATRSDMEKYLESWLPNRVEKDSTVFVYFSGHGAPNPKTGDAYLVPYDGDPTFVDKTGYPLKRLYEQLGALPTKEVVVLLDSCFSGAGGRSVIAKGTRPLAISVENPVLATGKMAVLSASSGAQISTTYMEKGHGLLTYFFLKGLQGEADWNKDGVIELTEVFQYVKPNVELVARREFNTEQTPQLLGGTEMLKRGVRLFERAAP